MTPTVGMQVEYWPKKRGAYQTLDAKQPLMGFIAGVHPAKVPTGDGGFSPSMTTLVNLAFFDGVGQPHRAEKVRWLEHGNEVDVAKETDWCGPPALFRGYDAMRRAAMSAQPPIKAMSNPIKEMPRLEPESGTVAQEKLLAASCSVKDIESSMDKMEAGQVDDEPDDTAEAKDGQNESNLPDSGRDETPLRVG